LRSFSRKSSAANPVDEPLTPVAKAVLKWAACTAAALIAGEAAGGGKIRGVIGSGGAFLCGIAVNGGVGGGGGAGDQVARGQDCTKADE
jgi:hypothetical protein